MSYNPGWFMVDVSYRMTYSVAMRKVKCEMRKPVVRGRALEARAFRVSGFKFRVGMTMRGAHWLMAADVLERRGVEAVGAD